MSAIVFQSESINKLNSSINDGIRLDSGLMTAHNTSFRLA